MSLFKFKKKESSQEELMRLKREEKELSANLKLEREVLALQVKKKKELQDLHDVQKQEKELRQEGSFSGKFKSALKKELILAGKGIRAGSLKLAELKRKGDKIRKKEGDYF